MSGTVRARDASSAEWTRLVLVVVPEGHGADPRKSRASARNTSLRYASAARSIPGVVRSLLPATLSVAIPRSTSQCAISSVSRSGENVGRPATRDRRTSRYLLLALAQSRATTLARAWRSPSTLSICSSADRKSSAISAARMWGSGNFAESSSDSSLSQKMSRLQLSRATRSSYLKTHERPLGCVVVVLVSLLTSASPRYRKGRSASAPRGSRCLCRPARHPRNAGRQTRPDSSSRC